MSHLSPVSKEQMSKRWKPVVPLLRTNTAPLNKNPVSSPTENTRILASDQISKNEENQFPGAKLETIVVLSSVHCLNVLLRKSSRSAWSLVWHKCFDKYSKQATFFPLKYFYSMFFTGIKQYWLKPRVMYE